MDFDEILNGIDAVREFQKEPAPEDQRIQRYFVETCGDVWRLASIAHYALPGMTLHVGLLGVRGGATMRVVAEAPDGTLTWGQIIGADNAEEGGEKATHGIDWDCLEPIFCAFTRIGKSILRDKKLCKKEKRHLCAQLEHAAQHLMEGA